MKEIYLDNAATTKPLPQVVERMVTALREDYYNPSALYRQGIDMEKAVQQVREAVADELGGEKCGVYFTSGGTEGNNMIIKGVVERMAKKKTRLITTEIEHPSVLEVFRFYEEYGLDVIYLPVDTKGYISLTDLEEAINEDTLIVSVMGVNNEIGTIQDLAAIGKTIKAKNPRCFFHCDYVQGFKKVPLNIKEAKIDGLTLAAHKIGGPKGVGAVYIRPDKRLKALLNGGGQEGNLRSGTENVPGILGLGAAIESFATKENWEHAQSVRQALISALAEKELDFVVNGEGSPYILSLSFTGVMGEVLLHSLESRGICVSTGSACSSHKKDRQYVLNAIGLAPEAKEGTIRVSFGPDNQAEDMAYVAQSIADALAEQAILLKKRRGRS